MNKKSKIVYGGIGAGVAFLVLLVVGFAIFYDELKDTVFKMASNSMAPTIVKGEYVEIDKIFPFEQIKKGDIIAFHPLHRPEGISIHRVESIISEDPLTLKLKGDANTAPVPERDFPITENEYIGKVLRVYPDIDSFNTGEGARYP